jgi:NADH dehydrogenase [ubiquinone] 1 alpha subcomplex assembly factor 5
MPLTTLPQSPLVAELAQRLSTRLADLRGAYTHTLTPPAVPTHAAYDALLLPGTLSLTDNPAVYLNRLLAHLRPEGAVLGWVLGEGSFPELHAACQTAGFAPPPALPAVQDVGGLLQRLGLALPVVDRDLITLTAPTPERLFAHLKTHGALQRPMHAGLLTQQSLQALYAALPRTPEGRVYVTLEIIFFHALTLGDAIPKAAKRGSAKAPLISILKPKE